MCHSLPECIYAALAAKQASHCVLLHFGTRTFSQLLLLPPENHSSELSDFAEIEVTRQLRVVCIKQFAKGGLVEWLEASSSGSRNLDGIADLCANWFKLG